VELAIRFLPNATEWIPLMLTHINNERNTVFRRGYAVPATHLFTGSDSPVEHKLQLCNFSSLGPIQFRWAANTTLMQDKPDIWSLDDVRILFSSNKSVNFTLFEESFQTLK